MNNLTLTSFNERRIASLRKTNRFATKDKNLKNPLVLSVAYGPHAAFMALRLKARFHASPDAIMALHAKHRQHQSKNPGFQPKKSLRDINVQKL
jgi:hypothetical protein